jgi:hypothetical protein
VTQPGRPPCDLCSLADNVNALAQAELFNGVPQPVRPTNGAVKKDHSDLDGPATRSKNEARQTSAGTQVEHLYDPAERLALVLRLGDGKRGGFKNGCAHLCEASRVLELPLDRQAPEEALVTRLAQERPEIVHERSRQLF